jgi:hypothetical protein
VGSEGASGLRDRFHNPVWCPEQSYRLRKKASEWRHAAVACLKGATEAAKALLAAGALSTTPPTDH